MTTSGLDVPSARLMTCGTAMPTKLMGPANAVTVAASKLDSKMSAMRNARMLTPMDRAYCSPSWNALMGLDKQNTAALAKMTTTTMMLTSFQLEPEKLPSDQFLRFTMLASDAKVIRKSVAAEQM